MRTLAGSRDSPSTIVTSTALSLSFAQSAISFVILRNRELDIVSELRLRLSVVQSSVLLVLFATIEEACVLAH
mgnify:CR=1